MELRVISRDDTMIELEIGGEDHTFMNVLKEALLEIDSVTAATYDMNPQQSGGQVEPVLTVKTSGGTDPLEVISQAAQNIQTRVESFRETFEAAV